MKMLIAKRLSLLLLFCLPATGLLAQEKEKDKDKKKYDHTKKKNVSETYDIARGGRVVLDNQFGDVKINVWSGSQVKLNITAETFSDNEEYAQKILDKIQLTYGKSGNDVKAKTSFENKAKEKDNKGKGSRMSINYEVFLPAWASLDIKNQFGDVVLPDYTGELNVSNQFGDVKAGSLGNVKKLEVKFGQADVKGISGGDVNIEFANEPVVLQNISGATDITIKFCSGGVYLYTGSNASASVDVQYSKFNLIADKNFSGKLSVSTNFGSFENKSAISINKTSKDDDRGPRFDHSYESNGSGNGQVKIKSSFTDLVISNQKETFSGKKNKSSKVMVDEDND